MRIYTGTGDHGETGLFGGRRVRKDDARVEAYGAVDELNAVLGLAIAGCADPQIAALLGSVQHDLFEVGADLATPPEAGERHGQATVQRLSGDRSAALEREIDRCDSELSPLRQFILPGGNLSAAKLHFARTVCRRAERRCTTLAALAESNAVNPEIIRYLNRLSDLLFVLARLANARSGVPDVPWRQGEKP